MTACYLLRHGMGRDEKYHKHTINTCGFEIDAFVTFTKKQCQWSHPEVKWTPEGVLGYFGKATDYPRYARLVVDPQVIDPGTGEPAKQTPQTIAVMMFHGHTSVTGDPRHFGWREVDCTDIPIITHDTKSENFNGIMTGGLIPGGPAQKSVSWKKASRKGRRKQAKGTWDPRWGIFCSHVDPHGLWPTCQSWMADL